MATIEISCEPAMQAHIQKVLSGEYAVVLPEDIEIRSFLDIGANVGAFTIWAKAKYPAAKVTAFEPEPENAGLFRANTDQLAGVWLLQRAIGAVNGRRHLFRGRNNCGEHSLFDCGEQDTSQSVEVECVIASCLPKSDWVKIDAEGAEVEILECMDLSETKVVTLEFHGRARGERCKDLLMPEFNLVSEMAGPGGARGIQKWTRKGIARNPIVFMALPRYGGGEPLFEDCLFRAGQAQSNIPFIKSDLIGDSLVPRSRNNLAWAFLRSQASHLLFIDTDLIFDRGQIDRLVGHDLPVVAGLYPKKERQLAWVCNIDPEHPDVAENGLQRVLYVGTGFMLIRRDALEQMMAAYPDAWFCSDAGEKEGERFEFFPVGVYHYTPDQQKRQGQPRARYLSEDWYACQRFHDMGIPVYADTRVILKHVGKYVYHEDAVFLASREQPKIETVAA